MKETSEKADIVPRAIPCDACRKVRVKCEWPEGGQDCTRCLRLAVGKPNRPPCSGPHRKRAPPCTRCSSSKLKCVWSESDPKTCVRCSAARKVCPGPKEAAHGHASPPKPKAIKTLDELPKSSNIVSVYNIRSIGSETLSARASRQLLDTRIAEEGLLHLRSLEYTVMEDALALAQNTPSREMTDVIKSLYSITGLRFTTHPALLGAFASMDQPNVFPDMNSISLSTDLNFLALYGPRREQILKELQVQTWDALGRLRNSQPPVTPPSNTSSPSTPSSETEALPKLDTTEAEVLSQKFLWVALVRQVKRVCDLPEGLEETLKVREHLAWATEMAVELKHDPRLSPEQRDLMAQSSYHMAISEGFLSIETGVPSLLSLEVYREACALSLSPTLPPVTSETISPIFADTPRAAIVHLSWNVLIDPLLDLAATLGRDIYANPSRLLSPKWYSVTWSVLDRILDHVEQVANLIIFDERARGSVIAEENAWRVLRSLFTVEMCFVHVGMCVYGVVQKKAGSSAEEMELVLNSIMRAEKLLARLSLRMRQIMCVPKSIPDVYYLLDNAVQNIELMGGSRTLLFGRLPQESQQWILKALRLAAFWEPKANHLIDELESTPTTMVRASDTFWNELPPVDAPAPEKVGADALWSIEELEKMSSTLVANAWNDLHAASPSP